MLANILLVAQTVLSVGLIVSILMQAKGAGVGGVFGGETAVYRSKRGVEKILHYGTIVMASLLGIVSLFAIIGKDRWF